jgi:transposase
MSTSLLYHAFGIRGYTYVRTDYGRRLVFTVQPDERVVRCSQCRSYNVVRRGTVRRVFKTLPIGRRQIHVAVPIPRVACRDCGCVRQIRLHFADPQRHYTTALERLVVELCRVMTIQDVAQYLGLSWKTVKQIHKRWLSRKFAHVKLKHLTHIAIDEICVAHPRKFLTLVLDLHSGAVVFIGKGKGKEALKPFWKRLKRSRARIQAVATDMAAAYVAAVLDKLPKAALVLDRFHVMKYYNDQLTKLRRQVQNAAKAMEKKVLKGLRWVLLMNPENTRGHEDPDKDPRKRLQEALAINEPLMMAYYMREDLRRFWEQPTRAQAATLLDNWIRRAEASGVAVLQRIGRQLRAFRFALLNWYEHRVSTGPLEATNNKIKTLQRRAYGYRDEAYFHLRICSLHETKYALVG